MATDNNAGMEMGEFILRNEIMHTQQTLDRLYMGAQSMGYDVDDMFDGGDFGDDIVAHEDEPQVAGRIRAASSGDNDDGEGFEGSDGDEGADEDNTPAPSRSRGAQAAIARQRNASAGAKGGPANDDGLTNDGKPDMRLAENRNDPEKQAGDYTDDELAAMFDEAAEKSTDGSIDLRTKEGRILHAAGLIDDDGFAVDDGDDEPEPQQNVRSGSTGKARQAAPAPRMQQAASRPTRRPGTGGRGPK